MRLVIFLLLALAIGKVATLAYIRQQSATATIINAYRDHAVAACGRQNIGAVGTAAQPGAAANQPAYRTADTEPDIELVIGRQDLDVRLWQTSNRHWRARYSDPFLLITSKGANGTVVCEYDIKRGTVHARATPQARSANNG